MNTTFIIDSSDSVKQYNFCGSELFLFNKIYILPTQAIPTKGEKHDYNTCEKCKQSLLSHKIAFSQFYDRFPNCCVYHKNLVKESVFKKEDFKSAIEWTAYKIIYTVNHIQNNIDKENWYTDIDDYIEYIVFTLGSMPKGCGSSFLAQHYFGTIEDFIKINLKKGQDDGKFNQILRLIEDNYTKPKPKANTTQINLLLDAYSNWLKFFPFGIEPFTKLKAYFSKNIPIISEKFRYNPYTKLSKAELVTIDGLLQLLVARTIELLASVNTKNLLEKGIITDLQRHRINVLGEEHAIKQKELLATNNPGEKKYISLLKKWLSNEKKFLSEYKEIITSKPMLISKSNKKNIALSEQYVKVELLSRLNEIEEKAKVVIHGFENSKIKCAAWVELLLDKKYFQKEYATKNRKIAGEFAEYRYGIDIKIQLSSGNKKVRETHKKQLEKHFK